MKRSYQVFNPSGEPVLASDTRCRYPAKVELSLLDAGYTIRIDGKRLTKAEIRKDPGRK